MSPPWLTNIGGSQMIYNAERAGSLGTLKDAKRVEEAKTSVRSGQIQTDQSDTVVRVRDTMHREVIRIVNGRLKVVAR